MSADIEISIYATYFTRNKVQCLCIKKFAYKNKQCYFNGTFSSYNIFASLGVSVSLHWMNSEAFTQGNSGACHPKWYTYAYRGSPQYLTYLCHVAFCILMIIVLTFKRDYGFSLLCGENLWLWRVLMLNTYVWHLWSAHTGSKSLQDMFPDVTDALRPPI